MNNGKNRRVKIHSLHFFFFLQELNRWFNVTFHGV